MRRRHAIALLATALVLPALAFAENRVPRLGYLWIGAEGTDGPTLGGLKKGLAELGYVEGRTIAVERRYAGGHPERLRALADELVAIPVDVILSPGTVVTHAVQKATGTIPVVAATGDPVGSGFVESLSRPGGNITGVSIGSSEAFAGKWIELLKEAVTRLTRVAVLYNAANDASVRQVRAVREAAVPIGVEIVPIDASAAEGLDAALRTIVKANATGLIVTDDPMIVTLRHRLIDFAAERHLPAMYGLDEFVAAGGFMSYSASVFDMWRRAAGYADRILRGEKPAEMPVEQPTTFELKINMRTARDLGLQLPPSLLARADEVIE